jgi:hypothetical protein
MVLMDEQALREAAKRVERAVKVKGPAPGQHEATMARHRKEWPTLWKALDDLLRSLEE